MNIDRSKSPTFRIQKQVSNSSSFDNPSTKSNVTKGEGQKTPRGNTPIDRHKTSN